jgi:WD40 repeat protein
MGDEDEAKETGTPVADVLQAYRSKRREAKEAWRQGGHATHGEGEGYFGAFQPTRVDERTERERRRGTGRGHAFVRPGLPEDDLLRKSHRPHLWSSRLYGEAHGDWESEVEAHVHPLAAADPAVVYDAYDGAWSCCNCHASRPAGQMHHCATCWSKRIKWDLCDGCWLHLRVRRFDGCTVARLEEFEWEMRDCLHAVRSWHDRLAETPRAMLTRLLAQGDQGVLLGGKPNGLIAVNNFRRVVATQLFGRDVDTASAAPTEQEVRALFAKYGQTSTWQATVPSKYEDYEIWRTGGRASDGLLPYDIFVRSLLAGASVQLAKRGFRMGPLRVDEPAEWPKQSMIRYPQCRRAVLPPSDWDGTKVARSARQPKASLKLSNIFGYVGRQAIGSSLVYTRTGEVVYHVASVAIVADVDSRQQTFFQGHDNAITALALHPFENMVATGQRVPKGSMTRPTVMLWDTSSMEIRARLELGHGDAFVCALGFCGEQGEFLATVSGNEDHTIRLWDWRENVAVSELPTKKGGDPPLIRGVRGNPYPLRPGATLDERKSRVELAVFGDACLLFYWLNEETKELERSDPSSGNCSLDTVFRDVCFLRSGHVIAAGDNGQLSVFYAGQGVQQLRNPHEPEMESFHAGGIRSMCTVPSELTIRADAERDVTEIVTAGGDGIVRQWKLQLEDFPIDLAPDKAPAPMSVRKQIPEQLDDKDEAEAATLRYRPSIVSLDVPYAEGTQKLLTGDAAGCIWELDDENDEDSRLLFAGHAGDVMDVAAHPTRSSLCATTGTDGSVYIWHISEKYHQLVRKIKLAVEDGDSSDALRAWRCSFSNDGTMLAVSTAGVVGSGAAETVDALPYSMPPVEGSAVVVVDVSELLLMPEDELAEPRFHCERCQQVGPGVVCKECDGWCSDGLAVGAAAPTRICQIDDVGMVEVLRFSPDDRYLAVGGHQRVVYILKVPQPDDGDAYNEGAQPPARSVWPERPRPKNCVGHSATILHLDWSKLSPDASDSDTTTYILRSTSADYDIMHWDVSGRQQLNNQRDTVWHEWSSTLGFEVMGIWSTTPTPTKSRDRKLEHGYISEIPNPGAVLMPDAATINALQRSPCGRYVVTGDDNSDVRLLNYPCVVADAPAHQAGNPDGRSGHSSFVTGVQWSNPLPGSMDSQFVLTSGGHDGTLFQWTVDHGPTPEDSPRERWDQRVQRAQFIAADDRDGLRDTPGFDGPRQGYVYQEDGPNGQGYYHAPEAPQWKKQAGTTRALDKLELLHQALQRLPIDHLRERVDPLELAERSRDPHSQLSFSLDETDRAQLIMTLMDREAAAMGPVGEGAPRIADDVIASAHRLQQVLQEVESLEHKVAGQKHELTRRDEEIAQLQAVLVAHSKSTQGTGSTSSRPRADADDHHPYDPTGESDRILGRARRVHSEGPDGRDSPGTNTKCGSGGADRGRRVDKTRSSATGSAGGQLRVGLGPVARATGQAGTAILIKALCSWTAQRVVEITFKEGEVLSLLRKESPEWWLAKLQNGQKGLVASRHFAVLEVL